MTTLTIYPKKLSNKFHVRVIAPSRSMKIISDSVIDIAQKRLEAIGAKVTFGKHVSELNDSYSSGIDSRLEDLHEAFMDRSVDAIFTAIGGYNAIQLIDKIDYEIIRNNPKILCGFSDISVLSNAIFSQTGLVGYSGPHFSSWGMNKGFVYTKKKLIECLFSNEPYELNASNRWSDDAWFLNQENREFIPNQGLIMANRGEATGQIVGGHLRCLASLQGTKFWPSLSKKILFIEEDEEIGIQLFDRLLHSLTLQEDFKNVKGLVIGRFQKKSDVSTDMLLNVINAKEKLNLIPVIINADFGHTTPIATFPIGGVCTLSSTEDKARIVINEH